MAVSDSVLLAWIRSGTAKRRILIEVGAQVGGSETTLYTSDKGYTTSSADTPASTNYLAKISGSISVTESISLDGSASFAIGEIEFDNKDGAIDAWQNYVFQGRPLKIYIGDLSWPIADFYKIFDGITAKVNVTRRDMITLILSDKLQKLNTTVSDVKLGGSTTNKDKLIPLLFGECHNISPLLVDIATHEYQIHNGAINEICEVRDNGVPIANDTIGWGAVTRFLTTGKFRLLAAPVGTITCDAQGDKPSTYGNDVVTLIKRLVKDYGLSGQRFTDADLDLTSLSTFAATNTQPLGIYLTEKANVLEVCQQLASSLGARVIMTMAGLMKIVKLDLPQATAGTTITTNDMVEFTLTPTEFPPVVAAVKLGYCKNWTPQVNLQTGIPANHIELFAEEWLTSTSTVPATATKYKLFSDPNQEDTLLLTTATTDTESLRRVNLWSVQRKVMQYGALPHLLLEQLGNSQTIQHARHNMAAGVRGQITSKTIDLITLDITMEVLV